VEEEEVNLVSKGKHGSKEERKQRRDMQKALTVGAYVYLGKRKQYGIIR